MQQHSTQQSNAESRPRPAQNLAENLPDLGELIPGQYETSGSLDLQEWTYRVAKRYVAPRLISLDACAVGSFFNRYVNMLGVGRQSGPQGQGCF